MDSIVNALSGYGQSLAFAGIALGFMMAIAFIRDFLVKEYKTIDQIVFKGNLAPALRLGGVFLALGLAFIGYLAGESANATFGQEVLTMLQEGAVMCVLIMLSAQVVDKAVLQGVSNNLAVADGNLAVGTVEFGAFTATGLIAWGSFTGTGSLAGALLFFVLGQAVLIGLAMLYQTRTRFDSGKEIAEDNRAAGLMLAGNMIAMGLILRGALAGPSASLWSDLVGFAASAVIGYLALAVVVWLIDLVLIPKKVVDDVIEEKNVAAIMMTVACKVAVAAVIGAVVV